MKYVLLTDEELIAHARHAREAGDHGKVALILEIMEYRNIYGPLGCGWLAYEFDNGFYRKERG